MLCVQLRCYRSQCALKDELEPSRVYRCADGADDNHPTPNLLLTYRSKASPSPIRGLFGRALSPEEIGMMPELSDSGEAMISHARAPLAERRPLAEGARL
jgi:hypothetical protein